MLLDVSYRLPAQLCAFVSEHVYAGRLSSYQASSSSAIGSRISRWVLLGAAVLACVQLPATVLLDQKSHVSQVLLYLCMRRVELVWHDMCGVQGFKEKSAFNKQEAETVREWAKLLQSQGHHNWKVSVQHFVITPASCKYGELPWQATQVVAPVAAPIARQLLPRSHGSFCPAAILKPYVLW